MYEDTMRSNEEKNKWQKTKSVLSERKRREEIKKKTKKVMKGELDFHKRR